MSLIFFVFEQVGAILNISLLQGNRFHVIATPCLFKYYSSIHKNPLKTFWCIRREGSCAFSSPDDDLLLCEIWMEKVIHKIHLQKRTTCVCVVKISARFCHVANENEVASIFIISTMCSAAAVHRNLPYITFIINRTQCAEKWLFL